MLTCGCDLGVPARHSRAYDFQVIKAAEDSALQYMNFMNVIFAAQKQVNWGYSLFFLIFI